MYNDILTIGPLTIHGYGLMIAIGILTALLIGEARAKRKGLNPDEMYNLTFCCGIGGFLGAKLMFCMVEWRSFLENPWVLLKSDGFVVYGGIILGVVSGYLWCRFRKLVFLDYFDMVMPSVAVAQGFGRIGCFLAGCCYGRETESWCGVIFTHSDYAPNGVRLIPTQLISSAGIFTIAGILMWYARKPRKQGQVGFLYMMLYSIGRTCVEFLRNDHRGAIGVFSTAQFISIFIFIIGVIGFWKMSMRKAVFAGGQETVSAARAESEGAE